MANRHASLVHDPFRKIFELRPAMAWAMSALWMVGVSISLKMFAWPIMLMIVVSLALAAIRINQSMKIMDFRLGLCGVKVELLATEKLLEKRDALKDQMWLGWGYRLQPKHTQLMNDIMGLNDDQIYPPEWYRKFRNRDIDPEKVKGLPWLAGLDEMRDVLVPYKALEGHTAILATTGAIKTRLLALMIMQCAMRGDAVCVLDPKGDKELETICRQVAEAIGKKDKYLMFHPGRSTSSFRLDTLATFERATQISSRIRMLMATKDDDNFVAYVSMTVTHLTACMRRIGVRPSYVSLNEHVQDMTCSEDLLEKVLVKFFHDRQENVMPVVEAKSREIGEDREKAKSKKSGRVEAPSFSTTRLQALVEIFNSQVDVAERPSEISGLIGALEANREWFGKMVVSLKPVLTKLTAGDLRDLLSPRYDDINDTRPIMTAQKFIEGGYIAYIGLDALSDSSVAAAVASAALADFSAAAGEIYNYSTNRGNKSLHIFGDEMGDLMCEVVIPIANKSRGAGIKLYLAGQSMSDAVDPLGSVDKAKRVFSNLNNLIVGATSDSDTLDFIQSKFAETTVRTATASKSLGQKTEDMGLEYASSRGVVQAPTQAPMVPPGVVTRLGDLQGLAILNRAAPWYFRIPVLTPASNEDQVQRAA